MRKCKHCNNSSSSTDDSKTLTNWKEFPALKTKKFQHTINRFRTHHLITINSHHSKIDSQNGMVHLPIKELISWLAKTKNKMRNLHSMRCITICNSISILHLNHYLETVCLLKKWGLMGEQTLEVLRELVELGILQVLIWQMLTSNQKANHPKDDGWYSLLSIKV